MRRRSWLVCNIFFFLSTSLFTYVCNMYPRYRRKSGRLHQEDLGRLIRIRLIDCTVLSVIISQKAPCLRHKQLRNVVKEFEENSNSFRYF
jgi:hypothetical protein